MAFIIWQFYACRQISSNDEKTMIECIRYPILVIAYNEKVRSSLVQNLLDLEVKAISCASFSEAEDVALGGIFNGILVDLQSIVKAKAEEKIVACSLTGFYPTLRVRALGSKIVPMIMPGDAKQDSTLYDFIHSTCSSFIPRRLRNFRRRDVILPVVFNRMIDSRGFTLNLSWGGAFIVDNYPEKHSEITSLYLPDFDLEIPTTTQWIQPWGRRLIPGFGVKFMLIDDRFAVHLTRLLNHDRNNARDRMVAR